MALHLGIVSLIALISVTLILPNQVSAADISKITGTNGDMDAIIIKGEFAKDDDKQFKKIAFDTDKAIIVFDSPGGLLFPALEIGKAIRLKGYSTAVIKSRCASACAIAWLAGQPRMLTKESSIGFHAVSVEDDKGKAVTTGVGNALVGSYLNSLGLGDEVVAFVTLAGPTDIKWLTKSKADQIGLKVEFIDNKREARANHKLALSHRWGIAQNPTEAARLYRLAGEEGFAGSQNNLGDLYETGEGVKANDKFAIYWYTRSAERGEPTAYLSLSSLLPIGTSDKDILVEALKYGILATKYLPNGKNKASAQANVKKISAQLSKEDKDHAVDLAAKWEPLYQEKYLMSDTPRK